jgi:hypothetical protein
MELQRGMHTDVDGSFDVAAHKVIVTHVNHEYLCPLWPAQHGS